MDNVQGVPESALVVFGGFVSEVNSFNLPAGSAAVATDCDYTVASVKTRDGVQNVYTYAGFCEGFSAGCASNFVDDENQTPWSDPANIVFDSPGTYASVASTSVSVSPIVGETSSAVGGAGTWNVVGNVVTGILAGSYAGPATLILSSNNFPLDSSSPVMISSITDNAGGLWANVVAPSTFTIQKTFPPPNSNPASFEVWAVTLAGGQPPGYEITVTFNSASFVGNDWNISVTPFEYCSGFDASASLIVTNVANPTGASITTSADRVIVALLAKDHSNIHPSSTYLQFMEGSFTNSAIAVYGSDSSDVVSTAGTYNPAWAINDTLPHDGNVVVTLALIPESSSSWGGSSEQLRAQCFAFSVPPTSAVLGLTVQVNGKQSVSADGITLQLTLLGGEAQPARNFVLPLTDGSVTFGPDLWDQPWTPAEINDPGFGFAIQAFAPDGAMVTFDISGVTVTVCFTPPNNCQFNYIKSFEMTDGDILTLALDACGTFWQEDVYNAPNILTPFYTAIEPNTFAVSVTEDDREFIALSDLQMGTDMPRQYTGQWVDRLSQIGPAAPPAISSTSTSYDVVSITQQGTRSIQGAQWNAGINSNSPGNSIAIYNQDPSFTAGMIVGQAIYLQFTAAAFTAANGTYIVTSVGSAFGMESGDGTQFYYLTVVAPSTQIARAFDNSIGVGTMQPTLATLTVAEPVPNIVVGSQVTLSGVTPSDWDATWTINGLINGATLQITQTSLTTDTATYEYTIISGVAPTVGQLVTVTGCTNGPVTPAGQSIFDTFQAQITSVSAGTFSIFPVNAADIPPAPETTAFAQVLGTEFTFDPGLNTVGTATDPIYGTGTGGTLVVAGSLGAGLRQCVVMFLTRNDFLTAPSPPIKFELGESANQITAANIPIGPPNVIARVLAFTGANGAFFFWLPKAETTISDAQAVTYTSTMINDNITTSATFTFTDTLLLSGESIDTQGSNNFAEIELGSSLGVITYADRIFAWGEQNKIQNLVNMTFDGGYVQVTPTTPLQPLGWNIDPVNGAGGSLVVSPLFGNAYQISNTSGMTQDVYGMITQSAYQDYDNVPIIDVQTTYSVRVTAESTAASGNLVIDLFSPSFGTAFGTFTVPLASMTARSQIFSGSLMALPFLTTVPQDLLLRVYATSIPNNAAVVIDRIEPFPTEQPVLSTQLRGSYEQNFEAFDGVTGNLGIGSQNQQPIINTFELFDNLYVVKSKSMFSTSDNGTTEPNRWNVRTVSNKVGTTSIHGVDVGEGWALICGEAGLYIFIGGEPVKISPELDGNPGFWQSISWQYGYTIWLRNDTNKRRIYIGIPIPTPNKWMPHFPANPNPTQPNVVLMCNYKELMTGAELQNQGPIRLAYTGELKSWAIGRKWSAWSIEACYADFIDRNNATSPIFFCADNGSGKIYQQVPNVYNDDGERMYFEYITYGFPKVSEAQQMQMGLHELQCDYLSLNVIGEGNLVPIVYPNSVDSPDAEALYPEPLQSPAPYGDMELPINQVGNRFFFGFSLNEVDEWLELSKLVAAMSPNPWAPVRGSN